MTENICHVTQVSLSLFLSPHVNNIFNSSKIPRPEISTHFGNSLKQSALSLSVLSHLPDSHVVVINELIPV